ncbi:hypothetical protein B484DRAFT_249019, partial [Ochromonadaceae sp. CCMP2298]
MADNTDQSGPETRLESPAGTPGTPLVTPVIAPPRVFSAVEQERHDNDAAHAKCMHDILGHLDGFGRIGSSEELDMEAYDLLCTIKGSALIPLRDLLGHGAQVRAQLLHFSQERADFFLAQGVAQRQLQEMTALRDTLKTELSNDRAAALLTRSNAGAPVGA